MNKSTTPPLPLIAKIAIAMTFINTWVIFEEAVVDRHGLWRYMPYYRVGLFCVWDAAVLAVTLLLLLVSVRPLRRRDGPTQSTTPPLPLIAKIAIAMTFLITLVILFVWPGVLLRVCFRSVSLLRSFNPQLSTVYEPLLLMSIVIPFLELMHYPLGHRFTL